MTGLSHRRERCLNPRFSASVFIRLPPVKKKDTIFCSYTATNVYPTFLKLIVKLIRQVFPFFFFHLFHLWKFHRTKAVAVLFRFILSFFFLLYLIFYNFVIGNEHFFYPKCFSLLLLCSIVNYMIHIISYQIQKKGGKLLESYLRNTFHLRNKELNSITPRSKILFIIIQL